MQHPANVIDAFAQRSCRRCTNGDGLKLALSLLHLKYAVLADNRHAAIAIQSYADAGGCRNVGNILPAVETLRIPVQYRQYVQRGRYRPGHSSAKRMMAMRHYALADG